MEKSINKIFLFSLPRAGSTLVQRILASHSKISSVSEPWFLLPYIYANKVGGIKSEYSHSVTAKGINDFISKLPNGINDYNIHLKNFLDNIYGLLSDENAIYFLDKTPRYSIIISEISKLYPTAKFLFLFRNPVHVFASMLSHGVDPTPSLKMLNHAQFYRDLIEGPDRLANGLSLLKDRSYSIQYEKFIQYPEKYLKEILDYLQLDYEKEILENFNNQKVEGLYGDIDGPKNYGNNISHEPLEKWKLAFNTKYRKRILLNYIENMDKEALKIMGYNKEEILSEVRLLKTGGDYSLYRDFIVYNKTKFKFKYSRLSYN